MPGRWRSSSAFAAPIFSPKVLSAGGLGPKAANNVSGILTVKDSAATAGAVARARNAKTAGLSGASSWNRP